MSVGAALALLGVAVVFGVGLAGLVELADECFSRVGVGVVPGGSGGRVGTGGGVGADDSAGTA